MIQSCSVLAMFQASGVASFPCSFSHIHVYAGVNETTVFLLSTCDGAVVAIWRLEVTLTVFVSRVCVNLFAPRHHSAVRTRVQSHDHAQAETTAGESRQLVRM
ncbi:hypothetical protein BJ912DRAFT_675902 [Pholiota molesta]|nr:hypothetical protein BJ912DRAFT_675902 [Pholiota molesta]